jgi:hypothetical protein
VYAVGADHPLREPCQQLIRAIADGTVLATTTIEVIQEFSHVRARRRDRKDAAELARDYIESPLLILEETDLREGPGVQNFQGSHSWPQPRRDFGPSTHHADAPGSRRPVAVTP